MNINDRENKFLHDDEHIVWQGKPYGHIFTNTDKFIIPQNLIFSTVFVSMFINAPFYHWFEPFILYFPLFYINIGRFFVKHFKNRRMQYFITNKRVIVITGFLKKIKSCSLKEIPSQRVGCRNNSILDYFSTGETNIGYKKYKNGFGDLWIGKTNWDY
ncbi:MAG: hypothetical protein FWD19_02420, partial [Defluviitaleaceae bacterium]|nr:hypothetical protein [Defluviitaleaceae bacterium]